MQEILVYLLPRSVLPFALTCKCNYRIALPIMYRQIALTGNTLPSFHAIQVVTGNPSLIWVRDIKLSSPACSSAALRSLLPTLTALPSLQSIDAGHFSPMGIAGWSALQEKFQHLPQTMELFVMRVCTREHDALTWNENVRRPSRNLCVKYFLPVRFVVHLSILPLPRPRHWYLPASSLGPPVSFSGPDHPFDSCSKLPKSHAPYDCLPRRPTRDRLILPPKPLPFSSHIYSIRTRLAV